MSAKSIAIFSPAPTGSRRGNRITALRWALVLRRLGHRVRFVRGDETPDADLLVSLHAKKSAAISARFREMNPNAKLIVALTGTDLYRDLKTDASAKANTEAADRLILLQPRGLDELQGSLRAKGRVIFQSASAPGSPIVLDPGAFSVCVLGHLREEKDPLRTPLAARRLPAGSRIRVWLIGEALDPHFFQLAEAEERDNPRFRWLGRLPRRRALRILEGCQLLVLSSRMEGGANAVMEAIACGVPVISSRISGSLGILGEAHPGYFEVEDEQTLASLLSRAETDATFYARLKSASAALSSLCAPAREIESWRDLIAEIFQGEPRGSKLASAEPSALAMDVRSGLSCEKKRLSCRYFYDQRGSELFEAICEQPEYYIPQAEREILLRTAPAIARLLSPDALVVELGSGGAKKTKLVLEAILKGRSRLDYVPIDLSQSALEQSVKDLSAALPGLSVEPIRAEYQQGLSWLASRRDRSKLVLWLGSNIGNLDRSSAADFISRVGSSLRGGDSFLLGIDLRKSKEVLEAAYDDAAGITAQFNLNLLARINQELGGEFDLEQFRHRAIYLETEGRIEMYLESRKAQRVRVRSLGLDVHFEAGERIHTEDSYKYSLQEIEALAGASGLTIARCDLDIQERFASVLFVPK